MPESSLARASAAWPGKSEPRQPSIMPRFRISRVPRPSAMPASSSAACCKACRWWRWKAASTPTKAIRSGRSLFRSASCGPSGAELLVVSNACGGMNPHYSQGDIVVIDDHINLMGDNPLSGQNDDALGPRFPDMSRPYDPVLIRRALEIARRENFVAHRGVYVARDRPEPRNPRRIPLPPHDRRRRGRHVHRARGDRGGSRRHAGLGPVDRHRHLSARRAEARPTSKRSSPRPTKPSRSCGRSCWACWRRKRAGRNATRIFAEPRSPNSVPLLACKQCRANWCCRTACKQAVAHIRE